jgi:carboxyl-terminal processing protease
MLNKRNLPIVLLVLGFGIVIALKTFAFTGNPPTRYEKILKNLSELLEEIHYSPKDIDDKFSAEVFKKYLGEVDVEKKIFIRISSMTKYWARLRCSLCPPL